MVKLMVAVMKKRDQCCLYAVLAAIGAVFLLSFFRGYSLSDWGVITWFGALAIVVAALVCMKCKQEDEEDQE
jgi:hypothetical protein